MNMDPTSIRHLHALRNFIRNLVEQAERANGCHCHRPPSLLLVGPPGAGKTYLVKQMSKVCEMPLYGVHTHQLAGLEGLRSLFNQARAIDYPSFFFLDDIDYIFNDHDKAKLITNTTDEEEQIIIESLRQELYRQLGPRKLKILDPDSVHNPVKHPTSDDEDSCCDSSSESEDDSSSLDNNGIILVAATSQPWLLYKDHELLSRFRGVYLVGLPDKEARYYLLKTLLERVEHNLTDKEISIAAERTEGFTPSDLMVVTKTLHHNQLAFFLSLAGVGGIGGSSDDEDSMTDTESDVTESDVESIDSNDSNQTDGTIHSGSKVNVTVISGIRKLTPSKISSNENENTLTRLEKDWASDEEDLELGSKNMKVAFSSTPKKNPLTTIAPVPIPSPDLKEVEEEEDMKMMINEALEDLDEACGKNEGEVSSPNCDNSLLDENSSSSTGENNTTKSTPECSFNVTSASSSSNLSVTDSPNKSLSSELNKSLSENEEATHLSNEGKNNSSVIDSDSDDEPKTFELHVYEPPNPLRNDNQGVVDSGSESDNDAPRVIFQRGGRLNNNNRRVNFSDSLSVDIEHNNNNDLDSYSNASAPSMPSPLEMDAEVDLIDKISYSASLVADQLLDKAPYGAIAAATSSNILKCLLSGNDDGKNDTDSNQDSFLGLFDSSSSGYDSKKDDDFKKNSGFIGLFGAAASTFHDDDRKKDNNEMDNKKNNFLSLFSNFEDESKKEDERDNKKENFMELFSSTRDFDDRKKDRDEHFYGRDVDAGPSMDLRSTLSNLKSELEMKFQQRGLGNDDDDREERDSKFSARSLREDDNIDRKYSPIRDNDSIKFSPRSIRDDDDIKFSPRNSVRDDDDDIKFSPRSLGADRKFSPISEMKYSPRSQRATDDLKFSARSVRDSDERKFSPRVLNGSDTEINVRNMDKFQTCVLVGGDGSSDEDKSSLRVQLTPTGSATSSRLTVDNSSDNGTSVHMVTESNSRESGINKIRDSDSPTIPSSDVSTGETLECHSDVEERFRNLNQDLKRKDPGEEEASIEEEVEDMNHIFNIASLGKATLKIVTLEDVLLAVKNTPRSVTDEEIKKYTDFMTWFANVAKSACPHTSKSSTRDSTSTFNLSVDTMDCGNSRSFNKKRKGPLKKLGRFLLKALMLLLD